MWGLGTEVWLGAAGLRGGFSFFFLFFFLFSAAASLFEKRGRAVALLDDGCTGGRKGGGEVQLCRRCGCAVAGLFRLEKSRRVVKGDWGMGDGDGSSHVFPHSHTHTLPI